MVFDSKVEAVLLLSTAIAINAVLFYGLITRPIIVYHLSTPLNYNGTIDFDSNELHVNLEAVNQGLSPARVAFVIRLYNLSVSSPQVVETSEGSGFSEHHISLDVPIHRSGHANYTFTLNASKNATHLVLIFFVEAQSQRDPVGGFYDSLAIYRPERPTALLLKYVDDRRFIRVSSR